MSRSTLIVVTGLLAALSMLAGARSEVGRGGGIVVLPNVVGPVETEEGREPRISLWFEQICEVTMQVPETLIGAPVAVDAGLAPAPSCGRTAGRFLTFTATDLRRVRAAGVEQLRTTIVGSAGLGLVIDLRFQAGGGMDLLVH